MPPSTRIVVRPSAIHGRGVFAGDDIPEGVRIGQGPHLNNIAIDVEPADLLIQLQKLLGSDRAGVESHEPVLNTYIVERSPREAGVGVSSVDADFVVVQVAPSTARVCDWVVDQCLRDG